MIYYIIIAVAAVLILSTVLYILILRKKNKVKDGEKVKNSIRDSFIHSNYYVDPKDISYKFLFIFAGLFGFAALIIYAVRNKLDERKEKKIEELPKKNLRKTVLKKYNRRQYRKLFPGKDSQISDILTGLGNICCIKPEGEENVYKILEIYENVNKGNYEYVNNAFADRSQAKRIIDYCKFQIDHGDK